MIKFTIAAILMIGAEAASAQDNACLTPEEARTLIGFAAPSLIEGAAAQCATSLPADAFLHTGATEMIERLRAEATAAGGDFGAILEKVGGKGMPAGVSEETTRSLMRDMFSAKLAEEIKPEDCGAISRLTSSFAPMSVDNLAALVGAILELVGPDKNAPLRICEG